MLFGLPDVQLGYPDFIVGLPVVFVNFSRLPYTSLSAQGADQPVKKKDKKRDRCGRIGRGNRREEIWVQGKS